MTHQILQLDSSGQPNKWISWKAAVTYHAKNLVAWELGEVEQVIHGGTSARTGERTVVITSSIMAVNGKVGKRKHRSPALNNPVLFKRDSYLCAYCGNKFPESKLTRDHIIPEKLNGPDTWMNCVTCCAKCNQKKDSQLLQDCGMQLLYAPYVPSHVEHLILKGRNILADQMEFLLSFVDEKSPLRSQLKH